VVVVHLPGDFPAAVELDDLVPVRERDECVAIVEADGGEGPVLRGAAAEFRQVGAQGVNLRPSGAYSFTAKASRCGTR
jgi:hypothetical protein